MEPLKSDEIPVYLKEASPPPSTTKQKDENTDIDYLWPAVLFWEVIWEEKSKHWWNRFLVNKRFLIAKISQNEILEGSDEVFVASHKDSIQQTNITLEWNEPHRLETQTWDSKSLSGADYKNTCAHLKNLSQQFTTKSFH